MRIAYLIILSLLTALLYSCGTSGEKELPAGLVNNPATASGKADSTGLPVIVFKNLEHDFGKVNEGEAVSFDFYFTNTGKSDLLISGVSTSCGCTVGDYPKEPVPSGKSNKINVIFKTEGRRGFQEKTITVLSNTIPNKTILTIRAQVAG